MAGLVAVCVALAAPSPILALLNGHTLDEIFLVRGGPSTAHLAIIAVSFSVVGALIASHRPGNPIGWVFCAAAFFYGLLNAGEEYAIYALLTNPGALPLGAELSWLATWIWAPGLSLILVFLPLLFPTGRPPSPRWWSVGWLGGLSIGLICVLNSIVIWPERGPALVRPGGFPELEGWRSALEGLSDLASLMILLAGLGGMISLFVRFHRARGDERQQIKWFASAAALSLVWIFVFGQSTLSGLPGAIVALSGLLVLPSIPIATGIAILRYRLYDIDRIINRTLVYGSLTLMLALVYFGGVTATQALFSAFTGQQEQPQLTIIVSTLVIAALFNPLRRRIQGFIDRHFYRRKYDTRKTLEAFSAKLRNETDLDALSDDLVGGGKGDDAARPCVCMVTSRDDSKGRAGRVAAGGLTTTHTRLSVYVLYCGSRLKTPPISVRLPQRPAGLPVLTSQSALRLSITTSLWVSSSKRSRKSSSSSG